jgi:hypothetical protein
MLLHKQYVTESKKSTDHKNSYFNLGPLLLKKKKHLRDSRNLDNIDKDIEKKKTSITRHIGRLQGPHGER